MGLWYERHSFSCYKQSQGLFDRPTRVLLSAFRGTIWTMYSAAVQKTNTWIWLFLSSTLIGNFDFSDIYFSHKVRCVSKKKIVMNMIFFFSFFFFFSRLKWTLLSKKDLYETVKLKCVKDLLKTVLCLVLALLIFYLIKTSALGHWLLV